MLYRGLAGRERGVFVEGDQAVESGRGGLATEHFGKGRHDSRRIGLAYGVEDTCDGFERPRAAFIFRALRDFAGDHNRAKVAFGPVIGGFDSVLFEEPQHVSPVVLPADSVQQALIVRVLG
jgi:hypothetical protein